MTETVHSLSEPSAPPDLNPALENTAVAHLCEVCAGSPARGAAHNPKRHPPPTPYVDLLFFRLIEIAY